MKLFWHIIGIIYCLLAFDTRADEVSEDEYNWYMSFMKSHGYDDPFGTRAL